MSNNSLHNGEAQRGVFFTPWRLACLAILILAAVVYLPALTGTFFWDDLELVGGKGIGGGDTLAHCFTRPFLYHYFRPLVSVSFFIENRLWHNIPFFYHQTNILLHVVTTGLLIGLLRVAFGSRRVALAGGALFAVQPVQVSAVAWIGGRTDSLCTLWVVCFAALLVRAAKATGRPRTAYLAASALAWIGALLTKEQTLATLPLVPLAFSCFATKDEPDPRRARWRATALFAAIGVGFIVLFVQFEPPIPHTVPLGLATQLAQGGRTLTYYTLVLLAPTPRWIHQFSLGAIEPAGWWAILGGYGVLLGAVALGWRWRHSAPAATWFLALTLLVLLPVSNLLPLPSLLVAPYRASISGLGMAALLGWAFAGTRWRLWQNRPPTALRWQGAVGALLAIWCLGLTAWDAQNWRDAETLFTTTVRYDPDSLLARYNLTAVLLNAYKPVPARRQMEALLQRLFGGPAWTHPETAVRALQSDPRLLRRIQENQGNHIPPQRWLAELYARLGFARLNTDDRKQAQIAFRTGLAFDPHVFEVTLGLGKCAYLDGDIPQALHWLHLALAADPSRTVTHVLLGKIYAEQGQWEEARQEFVACVRIQPEVGTSYIRLAEAQYHLGDMAGAAATLEQARRTPLGEVARKTLIDLRSGHPHFETL